MLDRQIRLVSKVTGDRMRLEKICIPRTQPTTSWLQASIARIEKLQTRKIHESFTMRNRARSLSMIGALLTALLAAPLPTLAQEMADVPVGRFSMGDLQGWENRSFKGETEYRIVNDGGVRVLSARTNGGASGRFRKVKIDLMQTPFINFSWKVSGVYKDINEATKSGDDFPARVYVVRERGLMGMNSISLNYVWSSARPVGSLWASPYTSQVKLLALNSGKQKASQWAKHKRNVREDLRRAFGEDITEIDAVALMSDADNFGGNVEAAYGDIWFSAR